MSKDTKTNYFNILIVISSIAVIFLHANIAFWEFSTEKYWFISNIIECLFYFAVPIFFMISGATLIDYRERYDTKTYLKKRIKKTFIPFICWSIIALIYIMIIYKNISIKDLSFNYIFNGIMESSFFSIYWFFPALFSVYLSIPIFSAIEKDKRNEVFSFFLISSFIINILFPFVNSVFNLGLKQSITVSICTGYIFYPILGYVLANRNITKKEEYFIYLLGFISLLVHIFGTYYLSIEELNIVNTFKGYLNVPCLFYSMAVFVFAKHHLSNIKSKLLNKVFDFLKDYTYSIYLIHWFILDFVSYTFMLDYKNIVFQLGMPFIIIPIAIIIIFIMRKIPIIKHLVQ